MGLGGETYAAGAGLQDYAMEYDGNLRRILTLAVVDSTDTLSVLNFRQFLIEMSANTTQGLDPALVSGAFRVQYIGAVVPLRCGGVGGMCSISPGIGRGGFHLLEGGNASTLGRRPYEGGGVRMLSR